MIESFFQHLLQAALDSKLQQSGVSGYSEAMHMIMNNDVSACVADQSGQCEVHARRPRASAANFATEAFSTRSLPIIKS